MKIVKILILLCSSFIQIPLQSKIMKPEPLLQMPSEEEMRQIEEFLQTLSPDELDQLAQLGEEMIREAEAEGRPLFAEPTPAAPVPPIEKPKEEAKKPVISESQKINLQALLISLLESIILIRQKASIDERYSLILTPLSSDIDTFIYYLYILQESMHLAHLYDAEFATLKTSFIKLESALSISANNLAIPPLLAPMNMTKKEKAKRRQLINNAESMLTDITGLLTQALHAESMLKECEKLLKRYEPDALKIKELQTKKSKIANEQIHRLPVTNTGKIVNAPSYNVKTAQSAPAPRGSSGGGSSYSPDRSQNRDRGSQQINTKPAQPAGQKGKKADEKNDVEKAPDPKAKAQEELDQSRTATNDNFKMLKETLFKLEKYLMGQKDTLSTFFNSYLTRDDVDPAFIQTISDVFEQINFELESASTSHEEWLKEAKIFSHKAGGFAELKNQKNKYINVINNQLKEFTSLKNRILTITENKDIVPEQLESFKAILDTTTEFLTKLTKEIDIAPTVPKKRDKKEKKKKGKNKKDSLQ